MSRFKILKINHDLSFKRRLMFSVLFCVALKISIAFPTNETNKNQIDNDERLSSFFTSAFRCLMEIKTKLFNTLLEALNEVLTGSIRCPLDDQVLHKGECLSLHLKKGFSWDKANDFCMMRGGHIYFPNLVGHHSIKDLVEVFNNLHDEYSDIYIHVGGHYSNGVFRDSEGKEIPIDNPLWGSDYNYGYLEPTSLHYFYNEGERINHDCMYLTSEGPPYDSFQLWDNPCEVIRDFLCSVQSNESATNIS